MRDFSLRLGIEDLAFTEWECSRSGNPAADWPLLQRISYDHPNLFWPLVLERLNVKFHTPPDRMVNPSSNEWLPGARMNSAP